MNTQINDLAAAMLGGWTGELSVRSVVLRILLSVMLAAIIGCERSSKRHSAGLRTFILVSLASTTAMLTDLYLCRSATEGFPLISAAAVVGAAMVSVNAILFSSKSQIKGLTTAAALWCCGLVGMALGAGLYTVASISFLALFSSLALFPPIETYMKDNSNHFEIHLELKSKGNLQYFVTTVRSLGIRIEDIESNPAYLNSGLSVYTVSLTINSAELKKYKKHSEIVEALRSLEYISHIEEIN